MHLRILLPVLLAAALTACASRGGVPRPFPGAPAPPGSGAVTATPETGATTSLLLTTALSYRGVPYRTGGSDPSGFDCSGFVQWVFAQNGLAVPREVRDQFRFGKKINRDDVRPGDLVFFETEKRGASHVGIALGGDEFVHAPSSRGVVRVERYSIEYWSTRYVGARRLIEP